MSDDSAKRKVTREAQTVIQAAFLDKQSSIKRFIARFLYDPQDIDDVAQETFLRAYSAEKSKTIDQPTSFLFRIAKHIAISQLRKKSRQVTDYIEDLGLSDVLYDEYSAEDQASAQQMLGIHCEALLELSPNVRRVYLMRKMYGMSHKEIAQHLGIAVSTVEKHMMKGIAVCDQYIRSKSEPVSVSRRVKTSSKECG